ncbi:4-carboxymuconolactone decarboxylase [Nonomuraea typhae]|uniref:bifunctional 3-oxoadipate enol-lactonase/4-carboxymuconolactone decarboxylase PcaDC n=1 Tax=Nonomuraea typhae TaxID=2603600 RepID=UPI0012F95AC1|nr:4-carboxymuconolactone decarboxylase [Nonomuraea typhae]
MTLHFRLDGPAHGVPLILGPSLGTSARVWEPQLPALTRTHRVLRYDLPGHGESPNVVVGTVGDLAEMVLELADAQGWADFHYAGISLGGAVGLTLALERPDRLRSLALICSSARFGTPETWRERAALVREHGTTALLEAAPGRWFATTPAGDDLRSATGDELRHALLGDLAATDRDAYAGCCDALAEFDARADLDKVAVPVLVVAGRQDPATPPADARELADGIEPATLVEIPAAAHLAGIDAPARVNAALDAHLDHSMGMAVRRAVLGDAHVDRAIASTTTFTATFQDFITRYAWGEIWTRPGLDRRTRSCITLTVLVARGNLDELAMHVRAALINGLTPDEIGEILLQCAVYCGVPAANAAFAVAQRVLTEDGVITA